MSSPAPRFLLLFTVLVACAVGVASAQAPTSDAQTRYMGAHVFERQADVFRRYCAQDAHGAARLETGLARFREANPDFVLALDTRSEDAAFIAGVEAFDARFDDIAGAMHEALSTRPPALQCAAIGERLGDMRFSAMIDEATRSVADTVTASLP